MAVYSRTQTSSNTQTATESPVMESRGIDSLIVKTLENALKDTENENLEETISQGINNSDLINKDKDKDKDKNTNKEKDDKEKDNGLSDLLKDTTSTNKELGNLLKNKTGDKDLDKTKDKNEDKKKTDEMSDLLKNKSSVKETGGIKEKLNTFKKSSIKDNSNKANDILTKGFMGGAIATTIGTIAKSSKGLVGGAKAAASGAIVGTGKVAGGLVSGVGDIGGGLIAGVGKLFGPIGAIIGKAVGTAVATPFKVLGGVITKATGALGAMLSMPLKELVTKGVLIVGVLSQLFVFLEGLLAKFLRDKDLKTIEMQAKIKSAIVMIPEKLMLSLEKLLSKVTIMGHPLFGDGLNKEEEKEYKKLQKDKTVVDYGNLIEVDIPEKEKQLQKLQSEMQIEYEHATGGELDFSKYNLNTTAGKEALKNDWLSQLPENERAAMAETIDSRLTDYSLYSGSLDDAQKRANYLSNNDPKVKRFIELKEQKEAGKTEEYFDKKEEEIKQKEQEKFQDYFVEGTVNYAKKNEGLTNYQLYQQAEKIGGEGTSQKIKETYSQKYEGEQLQTKGPTNAEKFLDNQYKAWTDSWKDITSHTIQNTIGIKADFKQRNELKNPNVGK